MYGDPRKDLAQAAHGSLPDFGAGRLYAHPAPYTEVAQNLTSGPKPGSAESVTNIWQMPPILIQQPATVPIHSSMSQRILSRYLQLPISRRMQAPAGSQ